MPKIGPSTSVVAISACLFGSHANLANARVAFFTSSDVPFSRPESRFCERATPKALANCAASSSSSCLFSSNDGVLDDLLPSSCVFISFSFFSPTLLASATFAKRVASLSTSVSASTARSFRSDTFPFSSRTIFSNALHRFSAVSSAVVVEASATASSSCSFCSKFRSVFNVSRSSLTFLASSMNSLFSPSKSFTRRFRSISSIPTTFAVTSRTMACAFASASSSIRSVST
mmetsp:Transcript_273/g.1033  ORF Transcript_273/g.1033 Transcript_273/m.1033 type:complete len:231 (-) Transcript_273:891-1583(-)